MKKETLCWSCQNYAKCSWSEGIPVEGWEATPKKIKHIDYEYDTYCVHKCPQYLPDRIIETPIPKICKMIGVSQRQFHRWAQDKEKSKKITKMLMEKGYIIRTYADDPYYYLEKVNNESDKGGISESD